MAMNNAQIPVTRGLTPAYALSLIAGLLMAVVSFAGLLFQNRLYLTEELRVSFVSNDVLNLFIGLPILLGSMWLTRDGKLIGLLIWPGALLYVLYNYMAYLFGNPFSWVSLIYFALVLLSAYIIFYLLRSIDQKSVQEQISGVVPVKSAGWFLVVFGILFLFRAAGIIAQAIMNQTALPVAETGTLIADLVLSTAWITGGTLLLRRMPLGFVSGMGLLFAAMMLFIGLILFLLLQPVLTDTPFAAAGVIQVLVMSMICFIPFVLFVRGVVSIGKSS